ncbi:MAG: hypothetical protein HZB98_11510 [Bacteroidia bacterium]|nr:hypothetical protein [Bacteroidia bacterium]
MYKIVNSTKYPGWGHMIDRGATTIWETWKESDNVYSNCHPMFGTITEWYFRWLAGIQPDDKYPGFEKFNLSPCLPEGLKSVNCSYKSPYGIIVSNWENKSKEKQQFYFEIPAGTEAHAIIPLKGGQIIKVSGSAGSSSLKEEGSTNRFNLKPGNYTFTVETE